MTFPLELRPGLRRDIAISRIKLAGKEKHNGDNWPTYGSDFFDYMDRFAVVAEEYKLIDDLQKKPFPVVVDLMASTDALASLFYDLPSENKLGIAIGRSDKRTAQEKLRDEKLGVNLITGDITSWKTWRELENALLGRKADLIVESAGWGLDFVPLSREFHIAVARRAWKLLSSNNGLILAQTRTSDELREEGIDLDKWVRKLNELGIPSKRAEDPRERIATISIQKRLDSPYNLPIDAGVEGIEPPVAVLETAGLPLTDTPLQANYKLLEDLKQY
jgi:hypothetical protein